ncbi:MAG: hypothetical protein ACQEUT_18135 [Bacillota bacterium]
MSSTNKTINFNLPQWLGSDYVKRDQMNEAFSIVDTEMKRLHDDRIHRGLVPPTNTNLLWIDTNTTPGVFRIWDGDSWEEAIRSKSENISILEFGASRFHEDNASYIQAALNKARDLGGGVVTVPFGTWKIKQGLKIYSNTTLLLSDRAVLQRNADIDNMIRNYDDGTKGGFTASKDIEIVGGTIDVNKALFTSKCTPVAFSHTSYVEVRGTKFKNGIDGNFILFAGCLYPKVEGCRFTDYQPGAEIKEAILISTPKNAAAYPWLTFYDETACAWAIIKNNTFERIQNGIGSRVVGVDLHTRVIIKGNLFDDVYEAVNGKNWELAEITENHINNYHIGIHLSSLGRVDGTYREIGYYKIDNNVLRLGNKVGYGSRAIYLEGSKTLGRLTFATVRGNNISELERNGISVEWNDNANIDGNTITYCGYNGINLFGSRWSQVNNNNCRLNNRYGIGNNDITIGSVNTLATETSNFLCSNNVVESLQVVNSTTGTLQGNNVTVAGKLVVNTDATKIVRRHNWIGDTFENSVG